jgi:hypothetical protein
VHAPAADFLGMRVIDDAAALRKLAPDVDVELLMRYLSVCRGVCDGDDAAGPIARAAPSERFHWITAPRSDVLQSSPVHEGVGDPRRALDDLFTTIIAPEPAP